MNKQGNDENVNSKTYIQKGFWISLGAAAGYRFGSKHYGHR